MTTTTTIDRAAYFAARREGYTPQSAAYVARPPVLDLDFTWHSQADGEWADFERGGRKFRATLLPEQEEHGCDEMVRAWRSQDQGMAWMTDDEFRRTDHQMLKVELLDDDGDEIDTEYLGGVCTLARNPTELRSSVRYVADTVADLAAQLLANEARNLVRQEGDRIERAARREAERQATIAGHLPAALRVVGDDHIDRADLLARLWTEIDEHHNPRGDEGRREGKVAATYFALLGAGDWITHDLTMAEAQRLTP